MACTKEQIENKRRAALERIRTKSNSQIHTENKPSPNPFKTNKPIKNGAIHQSVLGNTKYQPYNRMSNSPTPSQSIPSKVISGTLYMISEERFEVKPSEYSEQLITIFKTIPSKSYDCEKRLWNFLLQHYEQLQSQVAVLRPNIVLGVIPQWVLSVMREPQNNMNVDLSTIDQTLRHKLMKFQFDGVCFGIKKKGRCLIADDMGLGKTFQALAIAHYYSNDWPLLIVTTSSMRETWESKIHELLPSIPMPNIICVSSGKEKQFLSDKQAQVVIISYKMTTLCTDLLIEKRFGAVILDESHLLKSYKAQSTECVMKITKYSKRVILLSGTPALSRPSELYTQLQIIEPKFFQGFTEFGKRYCDGKQTKFGWDMSGQSNLTELQILLTKKFLIRRTKDQVLDRLKDKTRETVILNRSLLNLNEKTKEGLSQLATSYTSKKAVDKHSALLTFFSESAKAKLPAICKYVSDTLEGGEKFLIFAHHRNVIEGICHTLDENRVKYICIDGSTKSDQRSVLVDKFQCSDACRCAVLSITAANAGITLTAAQLVLFAELHWNPGILSQAESRAHRIGQEGGVSVKYLIAKGTSDDYMWPLLEEKLQVLNKVGLSKDTYGDTTLSNQSPVNGIENYFVPEKLDKNSYIPGTNIKKSSETQQNGASVSTNNFIPVSNVDDAFRDEDDELFASVVY